MRFTSKLSRRWFGLLLVLTLVRPASVPRPVQAERFSHRAKGPNILIIVSDDHTSGTMGVEGDPRRATPRLDRLAREGVRFDRAYCNSPLCTPSRQTLITGRLPHAIGVTQLTTPLPESTVTLGTWLSDLGYVTGAIGKMHFNDTSQHGFAERIDTPDWRAHLKAHPPVGGVPKRIWRPFHDPAAVWLNAAAESVGIPEASMEATYFADRAADFLERHKSEPFALVVGFHEPHSPFIFPTEWQGRYAPSLFSVPPVSESDRAEQPVIFAPLTPDDVRGIQSAYYASMSFMDHSVGRVLDALDRSGLAENTIVVYVSDNGYMLGDHGRFEKHVMYERAVRVPLMFRWPNHISAGRTADDLVELVDVFPTLMALCGLPAPPNQHGRSLVPLLTGQPGAKGREYIFSEYLENEEAMVRTARYKLIVGTGRRHRQDGYATANPLPGPYERLYDVVADPGETKDLSGNPDMAATLADLRGKLYFSLTATRGGQTPVPEGLTLRDAIHWCLVPRDVQTP